MHSNQGKVTMKPKYTSVPAKTKDESYAGSCPDDDRDKPVLRYKPDGMDRLPFLPKSKEEPNSIYGRMLQNKMSEKASWREMCCLLSSVVVTFIFVSLFIMYIFILPVIRDEVDPHLQNGANEECLATQYFTMPEPSMMKSMSDECTFSLVESIPQNLTFAPDKVVHPSTYAGLKMLLASAKKSVRIASFYWTLRGSDISFHDDTAEEGDDIFSALLQLSKESKVSLQIAQNAISNDTEVLAKEGHAEVRTLNFTRLMGGGILHTKFWLVDDQHFYIGSANLDWRSLTQVKELGILVQNCSRLGQDLQKIFDVYWYLGQPCASVPAKWPPQYNTNISAQTPAMVHFNNTQAPVYMSSSPPPFCPQGRTTDIDAIVKVISQAQHFVYIAVMDYSPTTLFKRPNTYWPVIDDALRHAAFDRRVSVRLLASHWAHTKKSMYTFLCSLKILGHLSYPKVSLEVKLFKVPVYSKNQSEIPFSRVNHNKYMVTDQHAYIGTSNWSGDYFISTAGVGFVVKQPQGSVNTTEGDLRGQLHDIFVRDWYSNYTSDLLCQFNYSEPTALPP